MKAGPRAGDVLAAALGAGLVAYVILRAWRIPFTHDEAFTYLHFVSKSFRTILLLEGPEASNDHLLNSVLMRTTLLIFGTGEFALRLPNVVAGALYVGAFWALLRRLALPCALAGFALAAANPFVLEFFGLGRGYGLALACLALGLVFLRRLLETESHPSWNATLATLCVALGATAQPVLLGLLGVLLILLAIVAVGRARRVGRRALVLLAGPAAVSALLTAALVRPILILRERHQFYAGGTTGLWTDSFRPLVWHSLYGASYEERLGSPLAAVLVLTLVGLCILMGVVAFRRSREPRGSTFLGVSALSFGWALALEGAHRAVGMNYPTDRLAIFFVPLLAAAVAFGLDVLARWRPSTGFASATAAMALVLVSFAHLARTANLTRSRLWWFDADTRNVLADLARFSSGRGKVHLGGDWIFEPALNYYRVTRDLAFLDPVVRYEPPSACNAWYLPPGEVPIPPGGFQLVKTYPVTGSRLALTGELASAP